VAEDDLFGYFLVWLATGRIPDDLDPEDEEALESLIEQHEAAKKSPKDTGR
jgi:hypothetical protein